MRRKHWCGRCAAGGPTHAALMYVPFICSFEKTDYKAKLSKLIGQLFGQNSVLAKLPLSL